MKKSYHLPVEPLQSPAGKLVTSAMEEFIQDRTKEKDFISVARAWRMFWISTGDCDIAGQKPFRWLGYPACYSELVFCQKPDCTCIE